IMTSRSIISTKLGDYGYFAIALAVAIALLFAWVFIKGGYLLTVLQLAMIYGVFCVGLNFFMGYTGQASFGQNAFAAIGGYGSAILTVQYGWEPILALVVSMAVAGVAAVVVGYPTLRLRGHYLAMATFALGLITYDVSVQWTDLTQGYMGYSGIPPLGIGPFTVEDDKLKLVCLAVILALGVWVSSRLRHSRFGRALRAISSTELGAAALGIRVSRYKLLAFIIAALYASAAGSLFAHTVGFISPEVFGLQMVVVTFTMLYVGGIGTVLGPAIGAVIASLLPEVVRSTGRFQDIAYAAVLILMLIFVPKGLSTLASIGRRRPIKAGAEG
ncbi:MAG: branched-chain amino acid ABC transporter permease, partial [Xanthobacteraceae bacterium]|nr:branched-chain amino acid ABC transporter permease [Xanthobacteraceae bacterium]